MDLNPRFPHLLKLHMKKYLLFLTPSLSINHVLYTIFMSWTDTNDLKMIDFAQISVSKTIHICTDVYCTVLHWTLKIPNTGSMDWFMMKYTRKRKLFFVSEKMSTIQRLIVVLVIYTWLLMSDAEEFF